MHVVEAVWFNIFSTEFNSLYRRGCNVFQLLAVSKGNIIQTLFTLMDLCVVTESKK